MTSARQIAANRRNAQRSTGPRTEGGKDRARRNALRHGLTAETVVAALEDATEYKAFEATLFATYTPVTPIECELVARLASLFWRLRRATAIETGLFSIQADIQRDRRHDKTKDAIARTVQSILKTASRGAVPTALNRNGPAAEPAVSPDDFAIEGALSIHRTEASNTPSAALCFLRLANLNGDAIDRIGRYEARLWKQAAQTMILLRTHRLLLTASKTQAN